MHSEVRLPASLLAKARSTLFALGYLSIPVTPWAAEPVALFLVILSQSGLAHYGLGTA